MRKKSVYSGKIVGLDIYDLTVEKRRVRREIIRHPGAAAILAFDEKGRVILTRQHRFGHGYILEIPAGTLERGESPVQCARRELVEETGYRASNMTKLISYYPSVGYNTEVIHCFVAARTRKVAEVDPDNDEFITVEKMALPRLVGMIRAGKIVDSKTICAVLTYAAKKRAAG